jgi:hypothetical protein
LYKMVQIVWNTIHPTNMVHSAKQTPTTVPVPVTGKSRSKSKSKSISQKRSPHEIRIDKVRRANRVAAELMRLLEVRTKLDAKIVSIQRREEKGMNVLVLHDTKHTAQA